MLPEDRLTSSNSHPGKPTGSSPAPTQVPSTGSGQVASTSLEKDYTKTMSPSAPSLISSGIVQANLAVRTFIVQQLQGLSPFKLWLASIFISVAATEIIVCVLELLLKGKVTFVNIFTVFLLAFLFD